MQTPLDLVTGVRLAILYGHLLLCVFALHGVLSADFRVLTGRDTRAEMERLHHQLVWLLGGLWITGLAMAAIDLNFDVTALPTRPKLIAKLTTVALLTLNSAVLRHYSLPRLLGDKPMRGVGRSLVILSGAMSTASWLMAAFYGIARPLQSWSVAQDLRLYGAVLLAAALGAALLDAFFLRRIGDDEHPLATAGQRLRGSSASLAVRPARRPPTTSGRLPSP